MKYVASSEVVVVGVSGWYDVSHLLTPAGHSVGTPVAHHVAYLLQMDKLSFPPY